MDKTEGSYRYFTPEEVEIIIKDNKQNQDDVWTAYSKLSEQQQNNLFKDKSILQQLTNKLNNNRTIKLIKNYKKLKSKGALIEYTTDLEEAFFNLTGNDIEALEETFSNKKERNGWILIQCLIYEVSQEKIECDLKDTEYETSQRNISKIISDNIDKLTKLLLMDR